MAERRFSAAIMIRREPNIVFAWVADHRNVPRVLEGVSRWEPLGGRDRGQGARFKVAMRALGVPLENILVLDTWDEPREIGWRSESGLIAQTGGWLFETQPGGTRVTLTICYHPPGGVVGRLLAGQVDSLIRGRLQAALERMKGIIESTP
ncbi:MAG TPA: SRPBCC family protein [Candidatus Dormibacteraeota bacterium]|nr:SRPBCC family protein [Candidatus Dormibacteraeota bacterium]